jgi:hypothetical protein
MRDWVKWALFANAYTPFFLILLIRDLQPGAWPPQGSPSARHAFWHLFGMPFFSWPVLALLIVSNLALLLFLRGAFLAPDPLPAFTTSTSKAADSLNYIVTYIIPFLDFDKHKDVMPLLILLVVIGVIYVHSNLLATNPMLSFFGYRLYELSSEGKDSFLLITKKSRQEIAQQRQQMLVVPVTDEIYLEVRG